VEAAAREDGGPRTPNQPGSTEASVTAWPRWESGAAAPPASTSIGFLPGAEEQSPQPLAALREPPHAAPSAQSSTRLTAADERSHCERSRASSRSPAAVSM